MKLTGTVVLPLASPNQAEKTARAVEPYLDEVERLVLVNVIEQTEGAPDKAPIGERREYADEVFEAGRQELASSDVRIDSELLFGESIARTVFGFCDEADASSVVILPRETNPIINLLIGDRLRSFVEHNNVPVVVLPSDE